MKTRSPIRHAASVSLAAALMLSSRALAQITVNTAVDENDMPAGQQVSLREALRDSADGGQIMFDAALNGKVLVLTAGEMAVIGKTLTVNAPGGLVIEARGLSRIFRVEAGAGLNLSGLTLQGGRAPGDGGAILNAGTLNLTVCVLRDNRAADGAGGTRGSSGRGYEDPNGFLAAGTGGPGGTGSHGGAVSNTGSLSVMRCHFIGNAAGSGGWGGSGGSMTYGFFPAVYGGKGGTGGPGGTGGAIMNSGSLELTGCVFESNSAGVGGGGGASGTPLGGYSGTRGGTSGNGGAVHQAGDMNVERCTFFGNACPPGGRPFLDGFAGGFGGQSGSGAAVFCSSGTANLTNATFTGNRSGESGPGAGSQSGGAIGAGAAQLRLVHCTVAGNLAPRVYPNSQITPWYASPTAGISSAGTVQCDNCILSGNLVNHTGTASTPVWTENNSSASLTVIPSGPLDGRPGTDAQLGALAVTSGPLPVLVPGATSPAVDAGVAVASPPAADQRELPRAIGAPDLGAVEVQWVETTPRAVQSISFSPPATAETPTVTLSATASSGLPVSFELVSGPATLDGNTLTPTGLGFVAVKAFQTGDTTAAPAQPVLRVIDVLQIPRMVQTIPFEPAQSYTVYPPSQTFVTLPATTSAGLGIAWSFVSPPPAWAILNGLQLTATSAGSLEIRGQQAGTELYLPVTSTWTLTFNQGTMWWETPPSPGGSGPHVYTLVEGSPHGLSMTARISPPHTSPLPVPSLPGGLITTPSIIPAGQTSVQCDITLPANPLLTNRSETLATGNPVQIFSTFVLANRLNVPLSVTAPAHVLAGTSTQVDVFCPGVQTPTFPGPPPDLGVRNFTVTAFDFDNPAIAIPVTLDSTSSNNAIFPTRYLRITFAPVNRRARLTVTTDDGITGQSGPIQILADTNADGDSINDLVEAALQRPADQFHGPPLTIEVDASGVHAVLGNKPLDLRGWTVVIEVSTDLQTWTPAPAGSTTVTPNPDGTTGRVSVLLSAGAPDYFVRLKATSPP